MSLHLLSQGVPLTPLSSTELSSLLSLSPAGPVLKFPPCIWFYFPGYCYFIVYTHSLPKLRRFCFVFWKFGLNLVPRWDFLGLPQFLQYHCSVSTLNQANIFLFHIFTHLFFTYEPVTWWNWNSSVDIVHWTTGLTSEESWFDFLQRQESVLSETSSLTLGLTQPPVAWAPMTLSLVIKWPGREAQHLSAPNTVIYEWSLPSFPATHTYTPLWRAEEQL